MRYAMVIEGKVTNIIEMNKRNEQYFPSAVYTGDKPVCIGDTYTDGKFYRNGVEVLTALEEAQIEVAEYKAALNTLGVETEGTVNEK